MRKEYDFSKAKKTRTFALGFLHLWLKFMNSLRAFCPDSTDKIFS
jgi:hypothetical protein